MLIAQTPGFVHVLSRDSVAVDTDRFVVQRQPEGERVATAWRQKMIRAAIEGPWRTSVYSSLGVIKADRGIAPRG